MNYIIWFSTWGVLQQKRLFTLSLIESSNGWFALLFIAKMFSRRSWLMLWGRTFIFKNNSHSLGNTATLLRITSLQPSEPISPRIPTHEWTAICLSAFPDHDWLDSNISPHYQMLASITCQQSRTIWMPCTCNNRIFVFSQCFF